MRGISLTYGQTTIDGGFIRTGEISSIDGVTKFNLNTGTISGRITFASGSSGYANISDKPVLGSLSGLNIVELAQLGTTVITGGYLATSLIDANYIRTIDLIANKVTTGKLQSVNTLNYFDLDNNKFKLGNATNYMDWNVTTPNVLTIKGHITADSGTISGVTINANDQFSLNGSKVEISPNAGMRVFGAGYADFTNATLKVPTVAASGLASGEAALWIGSLSGVASGASGGSVATLSDVALTGLATGQILVWNGATWVNQNNNPAVDLSGYYTKTETQNFFSGASSMSGYNKSNWDSAYAASHSHANKAFLDGITSGATVGINISGVAATSSMLMAQGAFLTTQNGNGSVYYNYAISHPQTGLFSAVDNSNSIITVNRHPGDYYSQLGFSSNGSLYYRSFSGTPINTSQAWKTVLDSGNFNSYAPTLTGGGASGTWGISISSNAATVTAYADTSVGWYPIVWRSGGVMYYTTGVEIYAAGSYIRSQYINTTDSLETSLTRFVIKNGDDYHRSVTSTTAAAAIQGAATGTWGINISGTAANASALGGYAASTFLGKNGTSYYQADTWIQFNSYGGLYWPAHYSTEVNANTVSTYTQLLLRGTKGGYSGIYDNSSGVNVAIYDSSGTGGVYREASNKWYWYYSISNDCVGIGSSSTSSGYAAQVNGALRSTGIIYSDSYIQAAGYLYTGYGVYDPSRDTYLLSHTNGFNMRSPNTTVSMAMLTAGGTARGYVYADSSNNIGFLNQSGSWILQTSTGAVAVHGSLSATGDVIAYSTSDKRLKEDLQPITNALEMVQLMGGYYYKWNDKQDTYQVGKTDIGVIAQEVELVLPELVTTRDNGYKAVKYEKIIPVLIQAIKELSQRLKMAERRVS